MRIILFDLDGTLLDTEEGVTKCVQYGLRHIGIEEPDLKKLRKFIGPPLREQFMEVYGLTMQQAEAAVAKHRERYAKYSTAESKLYPHVTETLRNLKKKGYILALASSKNESACVRLLRHFGIDGYFDLIGGAAEDGTVSQKADVLRMVMERLGNPNTEDYILIGDTRYDALGARKVGMDCVGVTYGFGSREELEAAGVVAICENLKEVEAYFESQRERSGGIF